MSPSKGTPRWAFRPPPELLAKAQAKAARTGTTLTAVIVAALEAYVREDYRHMSDDEREAMAAWLAARRVEGEGDE